MWTVRNASPHDLDTVVANNAAMALETEGKALDPAALRSGCAAALENPERARYWLAIDRAGRAVGQLMVTFEWSDWRNGMFWWIQSVYVHPEFRRQGVYRALNEYVQQSARRAENVCGLRLYVYRTNETARRTYEALGMTAYGYEVYETEF
ncbi:MAG: GNAT family N-acetyltransferase [Myxococcota bacterium]